MSKIAVIAAAGASHRTGLGQYTSKAALPLRGKPLLCHQVDFARRSGADHCIVVAQVAHVRLLSSLLSTEDKRYVAFMVSDWEAGWANRVEHALAHVGDDDQVLVISCDNFHDAPGVQWLSGEDFLFTFTRWDRLDIRPTNGPVFGCVAADPVWKQRPGPGFVGDFFTGYVVARGGALAEVLRDLPLSDRGEKEITALIDVASAQGRCTRLSYPGTYEDVSDLRSLALLHAGLSTRSPARVDLGAGVLLHDERGKVFLTDRQDGRGWVMPGGLVDAGEGYAHAARRELLEEAGVELAEEDVRLLGVYPSVGKGGDPSCSVIFHARVKSTIPVQVLAAECRDHGWFDREEARGLMIPFGLHLPVEDYFEGRQLDVRQEIG